LPAKTIKAIKNISTIENLCKLYLSRKSNSKIFNIILINGIIKPNRIIIKDKKVSPFTNKSLVIDRIENSDLKTQNSSMRAIGR
tara:strand:+ start:1214 stop:1465 length:252 start_codon:yes stop_codon:yes gene_type:complete